MAVCSPPSPPLPLPPLHFPFLLTFISCNPDQVITTISSHNRRVWTSIWLKVDLGQTDEKHQRQGLILTVHPLIVVLVKIWLKSALEETNIWSEHAYMSLSVSSYALSSEQPTASGALLHSSGLHNRISWVRTLLNFLGLLLKDERVFISLDTW